MSASVNPFELRQGSPQWLFGDPNLVEQVQGMFNPGEYAPSLEKGVLACADRYRAVVVYATNTVREIGQYRAARSYQGELAYINQCPPPRMGGVYQFCCPSIHASFGAMLIAVKTLLDALCEQLLGERVGQRMDGFQGKDGVVGGAVLSVLRHGMLRAGRPVYMELANLILAHKEEWIDGVVTMRDVVVHRGEIPSFLGFWVMREAGRVRPYTEADVHDPVLRIGGRVERAETYCQYLLLQVELFSVDFRDLLFPPSERAMLVRGRRRG